MEMVLLLDLLQPDNGTYSARKIKLLNFCLLNSNGESPSSRGLWSDFHSWPDVAVALSPLWAWKQHGTTRMLSWEQRWVATVSLTTEHSWTVKVCSLAFSGMKQSFKMVWWRCGVQCAISLAFMTSALTKVFYCDVLKRLITEWWFNSALKCLLVITTVWRNVIFPQGILMHF